MLKVPEFLLNSFLFWVYRRSLAEHLQSRKISEGYEQVVVLGNKLWRDRFGGETGIIGKTINLNGLTYTVVGVMPPGFAFPRAEEMPIMLSLPHQMQLWITG